MNYTDTSQNEFDIIIKAYAEVCGLQISITRLKFYYQQLKHVKVSDLKQAVRVFSSQGIFATVNEILNEAGYSPILNRKQRDAMEERNKQSDLKKSDEEAPLWETFYGEMAFRLTSTAPNKEMALKEIENLKYDRLIKNNWTILYLMHDKEGKIDIGSGMGKRQEIIYIHVYLCKRSK